MNTETLKTLEAVQDARLEVEGERGNPDLTSAEKRKMTDLAFVLKGMERTLIKEVKDDLISKLSADAEKLNELVAEMQTAITKLGDLAAKIKNAADKTEALIKIVGIAASVGLLG